MKLGVNRVKLCIDVPGHSYEFDVDPDDADRELQKLVFPDSVMVFEIDGKAKRIPVRNVCGVDVEHYRDREQVRIDLYQDDHGVLWLHSDQDESAMAWQVRLSELVESDLDGPDDEDLFLKHATEWYRGDRTMSPETDHGVPFRQLYPRLTGVAAVRPGQHGSETMVKLMPGVKHSAQARRYLGPNPFILAGLPVE